MLATAVHQGKRLGRPGSLAPLHRTLIGGSNASHKACDYLTNEVAGAFRARLGGRTSVTQRSVRALPSAVLFFDPLVRTGEGQQVLTDLPDLRAGQRGNLFHEQICDLGAEFRGGQNVVFVVEVVLGRP